MEALPNLPTEDMAERTEMQSQRSLVQQSLDRDPQKDVTPIRPKVLERHPAYVPPAKQDWDRVAYLEAENARLRAMLSGDAA